MRNPHIAPTLAALLLTLGLGSLATSHAAGRPAAPPITRIEYDGTLYFEAHFRHPGDVHPYHSHAVYVTDAVGNARLDWTTWEAGDSVRVAETYLLTQGRVVHRDAPGQPWQEYTGSRARQARLQASAGLPAPLEIITRAEPDKGGVWQRSGGQLSRYTFLQAHPRLGDVRDTVFYGYKRGDRAPDSLALALTMRGANWRLTARRTAWSRDALPDSLFALPGAIAPAPPEEDDETLERVPAFAQVADGVWSLELNDIDSRTVVVEFADHLAMLELAASSANGERIVDAAHQMWPNKPIRYALFSHYHPHYTGGLRAAIAAGATIVTTPGNEAFVRHLATLPFKTAPDRLERHPMPVHVTTFVDSIVLGDDRNQLVAYNYGERSMHTDEFVLFWLPRQQLLFETEMGWSKANGTVRAGRRARGLLTWIAEKHFDVERILQGWPMRDNDAVKMPGELEVLAPKSP